MTYSNNAFFTMGWVNCSGWCSGSGDVPPIVYSSPDGISWTGPLESSEYPSFAEDGYGVVFGNGVYIKIDHGNNSVSVSSDALTWTQFSLPSSSWNFQAKIYFVNETFYILGDYGYMAVSPDGGNWTLVIARPWPYIRDIASGDGIWVAVGGDAISASEDGVSWTRQFTTSDTDHNLNCVVYGNNTFVAVGVNGTVITSPDGKNWTHQILTNSRGFEDVSFGNGVFVGLTVGNGSSAVMTSPNGVNWTEGGERFGFGSRLTFGNGIFAAINPVTPGLVHTSSDGMTWIAHDLGDSPGINDIVFGNNTFVIVGNYGYVFRSHDGVNWFSAQSVGIHHPSGGVTYADLNSVTFGDGVFVAVGSGIASSSDGITWTTQKSITKNPLTSVAYINHSFMAGYYIGTSVADGVNGAVIQSTSIEGDINHDGHTFSWNLFMPAIME